MWIPICGDPHCPNKDEVDRLKEKVKELENLLRQEKDKRLSILRKVSEATGKKLSYGDNW